MNHSTGYEDIRESVGPQETVKIGSSLESERLNELKNTKIFLRTA